VTRPSWDQVWMGVADAVAPRSLCSRAKVGVAIVSSDNRLLSTGYNGPPRGLPVSGECTNWCPRAQRQSGTPSPVYDDCHAAHAESNAIARADFSEMQGSTVYVTTSMCRGCAKIVANSGVSTVIYRYAGDGSDAYRSPDETEEFLWSCGLEVVRWRDNAPSQ
jgi:dCMP deaminase